MSEVNNKGKTPEDYGFRKHAKEDFSIHLHEQAKVKKVIGVFSGKGGVGKSFVTAMIASGMQKRGHRCAVLDGDITGPSQGRTFGITSKAQGQKGMMFPAVTKTGVQVMSTNMLLDMDVQPVIWRGPVVANVLKQFYSEVLWEDVDYMFVDMPPGTSDVPLTLFQSVHLDGIIIISSPQDLVSMVVEKAINMARMMNVKVLGIVENMSYVPCPNCNEKIYIFGKSHVKETSMKYHLPLLAQIPMYASIPEACDQGKVEDLEIEELSPLLDFIESF
ncbi:MULTISPECIES: Mrp/NBP35 family ATP-binding protein [Terrabacteria group]|uniref:Mrp/NBP35 family ATP-binding protein n=1 Tax=Bacillati TaxID=1783272 RepID=UPI001C6ED975|nr:MULTISPECIES: Mrp/NBP35 family ATP-binding protein [Terrabacteria group]MBW9213051.1 Mrp/NBP35 family ATP-binding protein [Trueperella sp. zg.1013]